MVHYVYIGALRSAGRHTLCWHVTHISSAEVGSFIHVYPEAIKGGQLVEGLQLLTPILHTSLAQEIWKMRCSWPHL